MLATVIFNFFSDHSSLFHTGTSKNTQMLDFIFFSSTATYPPLRVAGIFSVTEFLSQPLPGISLDSHVFKDTSNHVSRPATLEKSRCIFYSEYFFALNRMHSFFTICYYYLFTYHYSTTVGPQRSHTYFFPRIELEYNFDSSFVLQYTMFEECLLGPTHVGVHCNCLPGVHSAIWWRVQERSEPSLKCSTSWDLLGDERSQESTTLESGLMFKAPNSSACVCVDDYVVPQKFHRAANQI